MTNTDGTQMKRYVYLFTRQDIFKEYQLVQTAHVALKLGTKMSKHEDPDNIYFTCIGVRNLEALKAVGTILDQFHFGYESFIEPDLNGGELTAIAVYPRDEDKRGVLLAFNLLKF
jgi:hypothetical protein